MLIPAWLNKQLKRRLFLVLFFSFSLSSCDFLSNRLLSKPVVELEDRQLTAQEFSRLLAAKLKDLDALSAKDPKILNIFKEQVVNDFIISTFIDLWFKENSLSLDSSVMEAEIKKFVSSYPSDSAFRESLSTAGLSYPQWHQKVEASMKKLRLLIELAKSASPPTEEELLSFYENHRTQFEQQESELLSHIAVSDENQAEIVKKLLRQQKFTDIAKKYSSAYTVESGDMYGWIEKDFFPGLEKAFKLGPGALLGPVRLSDGLHIFKIQERRAYKIKSFTDSRKQVLSEVLSLRETARFTAWLDVQIKKYKVKKNLSMLDSIHVETQ